MATVDTFQELTDGDRVLFNDRKHPLTVDTVEEGRIFITGPQGGEYMLFIAEDDEDVVLVAKPGQREYASYVTDLRVVGEWKKTDEGAWKHTDTRAEVTIQQNDAGFWTLDIHGFDNPPDIPKYGFTTRDIAEEEAQTLIDQNPEG